MVQRTAPKSEKLFLSREEESKLYEKALEIQKAVVELSEKTSLGHISQEEACTKGQLLHREYKLLVAHLGKVHVQLYDLALSIQNAAPEFNLLFANVKLMK